MKPNELEQLARKLLSGDLPIGDFVDQITPEKTADLGEVQLDLDRARRCGYPEVVYGEGKSAETLIAIFRRQRELDIDVLATRIDQAKADIILQEFAGARYNRLGRTFRIPAIAPPAGAAANRHQGRVALVTAGTSDLPVAEEARETLDWMGVEVSLVQDVGVAGPHRLVERLDQLHSADAVVVIAGMEGALPSVVGGYVGCPVVAVPTSVGYGASFGGIAALLGMLNSCAANVTVVNIDAGFKGGYVAGLIASRRHAPNQEPLAVRGKTSNRKRDT